MRLADFIIDKLPLILNEWDVFARSNKPASLSMNAKDLRNHSAQLLMAIAADLRTYQSRAQGVDKSQARGPEADENSVASTHGAARLVSGFTIVQLLAEYRALRSSVLRLWSDHGGQSGLPTDRDDVTRFNEAIDQLLAESVARYSTMINHSQHLFLAILGHDLRNPLNTTVVASEFLMRSPGLTAEHTKVAAGIHSSGLRMRRLVDDLIDYTRTHLGSALPMSLSEADMGTISRSAVDELRMAHPNRPITFESGKHLEGRWDAGRIAQVFSNLLGNAVQHGSPDAPVSMRVAPDGDHVTVDVHNAGKAIPADCLPSLFDPMVRHVDGAAPAAGNDSSLGIGLYIARAIIEAHGGTIGVRSEEGRGTTFTVRIPRLPVQANARF